MVQRNFKPVPAAAPGRSNQSSHSTGDLVRISGLYRSAHPDCRKAELWIGRGEVFPGCPACQRATTFVLEQAVQHISEDPDFQ